MSILAYSELFRLITGIDEGNMVEPYKILSKHNSTKKRIAVLKTLAKHDGLALSSLLKLSGMPSGGGSYNNIKSYFNALEAEGLLFKVVSFGKVNWFFSKDYYDFRDFILTS